MNLNLNLYRKLDTKKLSKEAVAYLIKHEGSADLVDNNKPRDLEWTEEILPATVGFVILDAEGEVMAEFDDIAKAEKALAGAHVKFAIELEGD